MIGVSFAGFRSQIKFYSVLEPIKLYNYISELLDAGLLGPLFKVCLPLYHRMGNHSLTNMMKVGSSQWCGGCYFAILFWGSDLQLDLGFDLCCQVIFGFWSLSWVWRWGFPVSWNLFSFGLGFTC